MPQRKGSDFAGLSVAIVTPFSNGEVDYDRLRAQLEFQIEAGTTCIVPAGTTGESPTLSHNEHDRLISEVIQIVAGRAKVMAGTGSNSTAEALRLTKRAADEGADATLQVAPYYNKPTQEGFFQHFKAVAEHVLLRTGPVFVDRRHNRLDGSQRRRFADLADDERWSGRGCLRCRQLGADRYDQLGACGQRRRHGRSDGNASQVVHVVPKHAGAGDQSHSVESSDGNGRSRLR